MPYGSKEGWAQIFSARGTDCGELDEHRFLTSAFQIMELPLGRDLTLPLPHQRVGR